MQAAAQAAANNKQELWKGVEQKKQKKVVVKSRTEEEAKAAELELLAELDREEEVRSGDLRINERRSELLRRSVSVSVSVSVISN